MENSSSDGGASGGHLRVCPQHHIIIVFSTERALAPTLTNEVWEGVHFSIGINRKEKILIPMLHN
ncbi:hypothetical protein PR048_002242 [Dryococelus australis]|uniref:Uncharacterized protein n=1 Tax=Dryococelus australis TaxID=614101 RepID=A0ABQ9IJM7_9NEOP|nr:hypothetical protein PR048_002242 [Dryococelus australis]